MSHRIVKGVDTRITITVKEDGLAQDISSATTVTVYLNTYDGSDNGVVRLSSVADSGATGANFANGVIVVTFTAVQTATLIANERLWLSVTVDTSDAWVKSDFGSHAQSIPVYSHPAS